MSSSAKLRSAKLYGEDLARIHIEGYAFHWEGAAPVVLNWLQEHRIESGLLVDLGCGGGQWVAYAAARGYQTVGIDVSASMIRRAKQASPSTQFVCSSFADTKLPTCDVVTSLGEPLNYLNSGRLIQQTIRNVYAALRKGGLFVFDVRHPPLHRVDSVTHVKADNDWFCHAQIDEDPKQLVRHITTFQKVGKHFRRDQETHRLKLYSKQKMLDWLRATGFRVRSFRGYGDYRLTDRQSVFLCRKP